MNWTRVNLSCMATVSFEVLLEFYSRRSQIGSLAFLFVMTEMN